jgi:serine phosphatase RsbU (regulator of sigma subunit)
MNRYLMYISSFRLPFLCLLIIGSVGIAPAVAADAKGRPAREQLAMYKDSVSLSMSGKTKRETGYYMNQLANLFLIHKQNKEGIAYFDQWLRDNASRAQSSPAAAASYMALGKLYLATFNKKGLAPEAFHKAVAIYRRRKDKAGLSDALINEATGLMRNNRFDKALTALEEALPLAKKVDDLHLQRTAYGLLGEVHKQLGHYKPSLEAMTRHTELDKRIRANEVQVKEEQMRQQTEEMMAREEEVQRVNEELEERSMRAEREISRKERDLRSTQQTLRETEKITRERQLEIDNLKKEAQIKELTLRKQEETLRFERYVRYSLMILALLIFVFLTVAYWGYLQKRKANIQLMKQKKEIQDQHDEIEQQSLALMGAIREIEKKNHDITSSITYAQRIQQAILPDWEEIRHVFADSFLLYRPRDIVSGDFFWFARKNGKVIIAAVDCTGHGVPGAFISMAGHTWLKHIVHERGITQADEILNQLHQDLRQSLRQERTENRDGMDLALVVVDEKAGILEFAGAKNPVVIIQNGEMKVVKGDRQAIGGHQHEVERKFTRHVFRLNTPTRFYLFSDGFQDQFGGTDNQKFMVKRFHKLIHELHLQPMEKQLKALQQDLDNWMAGYRQIDDILVMGFRVGADKPVATISQTDSLSASAEVKV